MAGKGCKPVGFSSCICGGRKSMKPLRLTWTFHFYEWIGLDWMWDMGEKNVGCINFHWKNPECTHLIWTYSGFPVPRCSNESCEEVFFGFKKNTEKTVGNYLDAKDWSVSKKNIFTKKNLRTPPLNWLNSFLPKKKYLKWRNKIIQDSKVDQTA